MDENKFERAQTVAAYKRVFLTADGKHVLQDLAIEAGLDRPCFDPDPYISAYQNGRRDAVLEVFRKLHINIVEYMSSDIQQEDF